jgi:tRNA1(Val) A37 N6-methylase TrmN6
VFSVLYTPPPIQHIAHHEKENSEHYCTSYLDSFFQPGGSVVFILRAHALSQCLKIFPVTTLMLRDKTSETAHSAWRSGQNAEVEFLNKSRILLLIR